MVIKNKFIIRSFSWVAFANFITKPLWLLLFIYAARVLGVEQYGVYTYALSIVMMISIFLDLGLDYIAIREISKNNELINEYSSQVLFLRVIFFVVILLVLGAYFIFSRKLDKIQSLAIIITLVFQFSAILLAYFKSVATAFHEFKVFSFMMIFEKILLIILGFLSLLILPKIISFLLSMVIANTISLVIFLITLRKRYKLKFYLPVLSVTKGIVKEAIPLLTMNLFILAYFRVDVIILDWITQDKSIVGIYGAIHRIVEMYMLIPTILMTTAYPIINKYLESNREFVDNFLHKILYSVISISLPIAILIAFNSYELNYFMFGSQYAEGSKGLLYIIWTIIPLGLNYILGNILISMKKQYFCAIGVGIGASVNIILNLILIPKLSFVGASITTFITESVILLVYGYFIIKLFPRIQLLQLGLKTALISGIILFTFYFYLQLFNYNFLVSITLGLLLTISLLFLSGILNIKEINKLLRSIL